jgi:hypothetical protein
MEVSVPFARRPGDFDNVCTTGNFPLPESTLSESPEGFDQEGDLSCQVIDRYSGESQVFECVAVSAFLQINNRI